MRLAISRRAAPDVPLPRLCELARARGLDGVELSPADLDDASVDEATGFVVGVHVESAAAAASPLTARRAARLGAPVIAAPGAIDLGSLAELDALYRGEGAQLLVSHGTAVAHAAELMEGIANAGASSVSAAWEVHTKRDDLREAPAVLLTTIGVLRYVRMRGGGPELGDEDSAGTGELVSSLALSGFSGVVTLAPTTNDRVDSWGRWLAGKIKNGCGTAHAKSKKSKPRNVDLDIRSVEPRDRMGTILGAYHALAPGRTLHVTFDHDPSCMFYTLQATEPDGSFVFERRDDGPDVWRADVTKRAP